MTRKCIIVASVAGLAIWCSSGSAWADLAPCPDVDSVTRKAKQRARVLADEAHQAHLYLKYKNAAQLYEQALKLWPRPELYRQAGMAYAQALELLPAYEHLSHSLRCGLEFLSDKERTDAEAVMERLEPWFGELEVHCEQIDLQVQVDGESWLTCSDGATGRERRVVMAGQHEIVASKAGYLTMRKTVLVEARRRVTVEAWVIPEEQAMITKRRWQRWKPWSITGAGAVMLGIGMGLRWRAEVSANAAQQAVDEGCPLVPCEPPRTDLFRRAGSQNNLGLGGMAVGGLMMVAGMLGVWLNQPKNERLANDSATRVRNEPMVLLNGVGWWLKGSF